MMSLTAIDASVINSACHSGARAPPNAPSAPLAAKFGGFTNGKTRMTVARTVATTHNIGCAAFSDASLVAAAAPARWGVGFMKTSYSAGHYRQATLGLPDRRAH